MSKFLPCPFCGDKEPVFQGNGDCWYDDYRYIEMKIECGCCCASIYETMNWQTARTMKEKEREALMKANLTKKWNTRFKQENNDGTN